MQNITRSKVTQPLATIKDWMAKMTEAIRAVDSETLITVDLLALGDYKVYADDLDLLSPHIYPRTGEIDKSVQKVIANVSSVPVVIEESSNLHCTAEELAGFLQEIDGHYQGLMGHYFGKKLDEYGGNTISDALKRNFLQFFIDENPN